MAKWKIAVLLICFLAVSPAVGQGPDNNYGGLFKATTFEIGPEIFHQKYTEVGVKIYGMMYGLCWSYTDRGWLEQDEDETPADKPARWMVGTDGSVSYGQVNYDGELMRGTPYATDEENWMVETRLLFGPDFPSEKRIDTIYTGLGFRYLNNNSSDSAAYERESHYFYMPVGITTMGKLNKDWLVGITGEFDVFLYGVQTSHFHNLGVDIHNQQHKGYGVRGSIKLGKQDGEHNLIIEPFVRYWKIQISEESLGVVEPHNDTTEIGARLIWRF